MPTALVSNTLPLSYPQHREHLLVKPSTIMGLIMVSAAASACGAVPPTAGATEVRACHPGLWVRYMQQSDIDLDDAFDEIPEDVAPFYTDCTDYLVSKIVWDSGRIGHEPRDYCADPIHLTEGVIRGRDLASRGFVLVPLGDVMILEGNGMIWPYVRCGSGIPAGRESEAEEQHFVCAIIAPAAHYDPSQMRPCGE